MIKVSTILKTERGSPIRRSRLGVGKETPEAFYLHRIYADALPDQPGLHRAMARLPKGFTYNVIKAAKNGTYTFFNSPDFDTADEPIGGPCMRVSPDGKVTSDTSNSIWHHKWLWVKDDYPGFDVDASKERSAKWLKLPGIDFHNIGNKAFWEANVVPHIK